MFYPIIYMSTAVAPIALAFGVLDLTGSTADAALVIAALTLAPIDVLLIDSISFVIYALSIISFDPSDEVK